MEPILTTILAALAAGAIAKSKEVASQAVTDAYEGLKNLLQHKLGRSGAVQSVEDDPQSEAAHTALAEALTKKELQADTELRDRAQHLEKALSESNASAVPGAGDIEIQMVRGHVNAAISNLVASGRIKLDSLIADTGDATVKDLSAGRRDNSESRRMNSPSGERIAGGPEKNQLR